MKTLNVGVIGHGWVATAHIPAINATGTITARLDGSMSRPLRRQYLVAWALCRQAIRAIRREEGQPGASPET